MRRESRSGLMDTAAARAASSTRLAAGSVLSGAIATAASLIAVAFLATAGGAQSQPDRREERVVPVASPRRMALEEAAPAADPDAAERVGRFQLVDVAPSIASLDDELTHQRALARALGQRLVVWLVIDDYRSCAATERALGAPELQLALPELRLVRVDAMHFLVELSRLGVPLEAFPGFALLGSDGRATDYLDSREWGPDLPASIAPVLKSFVEGTYRERHAPYRGGPRDDEAPI